MTSIRRGGPLVAVVLTILSTSACSGASPTIRPPEYPLVPCQLNASGAPTAPPGYTLVPPGTIAFTQDSWLNMTEPYAMCGIQAVRGATRVIDLSSLDGEDRILWVATLARPGQPPTPDPVPPIVTIFRLDPGGPVAVATQVEEGTGSRSEQYRMMGNYGHDAEPGSYIMRIVSGTGILLAEGSFEIVR